MTTQRHSTNFLFIKGSRIEGSLKNFIFGHCLCQKIIHIFLIRLFYDINDLWILINDYSPQSQCTLYNYWMRMSIISIIIHTEVNVICRSWWLKRIALTEVWIILDIMRKPNIIIVLLCTQNSDRYKKRFAVKRLVRLTFETVVSHFWSLEVVTSSGPIIFFLDSSVE